ncbi:MAG: hypothetical protein WCP55_00390 [Lentisphaerota bacterium]
MKSFLDYLNEAETKTKTKSKVNLGPDLDAPTDSPLANRPTPDAPRATVAPERRKASAADTARATSGIHNPAMAQRLASMRNIEPEVDDDDWGFADPDPEMALDTEVRTANLPAVAGQALQAAGVQGPDFHKVSNLPGNMSRAIRSLGKQLFRSMTRTPTDDIYVVANLGGQGPNSTQEVNAVAGWVRKNGDALGPGNIDFDTTIPGYNANIHQYSAGGIRWLLVQDEFGNYIYSWPESDSIEHANTPELGHDRPRLA